MERGHGAMIDTVSESLKSFAGFPCVIFPASRALGKDAEVIGEKLGAFLTRWESHGSPVQGGFAILEDRFIVVSHRPLEISDREILRSF